MGPSSRPSRLSLRNLLPSPHKQETNHTIRMKHIFRIFLTALLILSANLNASAQMAVTDIFSQALQRLADLNRSAEWETTIQNALATLETVNESLNEARQSNKNWDFLTTANDWFTTAMDWKRFGKEEALLIGTYTDSIRDIKYMVSSGYLNPNYAMGIIRDMSRDMTDIVKTTRYMQGFFTAANNKSITNEEKLRQVRAYTDSLRTTRMGMNKVMSNIYGDLNQEITKAIMFEEMQRGIANSKTSINPPINNDKFSFDKIGFSLESKMPKTSKQVAQDIQTHFYNKSHIEQERQIVKDEVKKSLGGTTQANGPLYRLAQIIIVLLSALYMVINYVRVTKGEGGSKDALLKTMLGLLFGLGALGVLEAFFGSNPLFN